MALIGLAGCTASPILYYLLVKSGYQNPSELMVLVALINLCATSVWRYFVHHRALPYCRQGVQFWNRVQRSDHNPGIFFVLHAWFEGIWNPLRLYRTRHFCAGLASVVAVSISATPGGW